MVLTWAVLEEAHVSLQQMEPIGGSNIKKAGSVPGECGTGGNGGESGMGFGRRKKSGAVSRESFNV